MGGERGERERKKVEEEEERGNRKKRSKVLRKGSISSTTQTHDFEPSYQYGQEFANLSHRFSEKCWGQLQSQWKEAA